MGVQPGSKVYEKDHGPDKETPVEAGYVDHYVRDNVVRIRDTEKVVAESDTESGTSYAEDMAVTPVSRRRYNGNDDTWLELA